MLDSRNVNTMVSECIRCTQHYENFEALVDHLRTSQAHHVCRTCVIDFPLRILLIQHYVMSPLHYYCQRCDSHFDSPLDLIGHFGSAHSQCLLCGLPFATLNDLVEHYARSHHTCFDCRQVCGTPAALDAHFRDTHWYCADCRRVFRNAERLRTHLEYSSIHKGRNVFCPGRACLSAFASSSALIQHLESGGCRSGMVRHDVNRLTVALDVDNVVTNPARLLGEPGAYVPPGATTLRATERSRNPATRLYDCAVCGTGFRRLGDLNSHLASPVHDERIYRCPTAWRGCEAEFATLSALCQHVESGTCEAHKFNSSIQRHVGSLADGMNRLAL